MPSIIQRIALEGGQEIKATLESISATGAAAFRKLQDAAKNINLDFAPKIAAGLEAIGSKVEQIKKSFGELGDSVSNFEHKTTSTIKSVALLGAALVGAVVGVVAFVKGTTDSQESLNRMASILGVTTQKMSEMRFASIAAGVSADEYAVAMAHLASATDKVRQSQITFENKQATLNREVALGRTTFAEANKQIQDTRFQLNLTSDAFQRLGVRVLDDTGRVRDLSEIEKDFADGLKDVDSAAERSALVFEAFGTKTKSMVQKLELGRDGIEKLEAEARRVAPALSEQAAGAVDKLNSSLHTLDETTKSTKNSVVSILAPALTRLFTGITEAIVRARPTIIEFAGLIADKLKVAVDDIIKILNGEQPTPGGFIESAHLALKGFVETAKSAGTIIAAAFNLIKTAADIVATAINELFGTKTTGGALLMVAVILRLTGVFGLLTAAISLGATAVGLFVTAFGPVGLAVAALAIAAGLLAAKYTGAADAAKNKFKDAFDEIQRKQQETNDKANVVNDQATAAFGRSLDGQKTKAAATYEEISKGATQVGTAFEKVASEVNPVWEQIKAAAQISFNAIAAHAARIAQQLTTAFNFSSAVTAFQTFVAVVKTGLDEIIAKANEAAKALRDVASASAESGGGGGGGDTGFARGGHVRGPGGSVGDKIRAWLSDNEFVHRAAAVRKYGLAFMNAINDGRIPEAAARALMGFTSGAADSLASVAPRTRFADGGLAMAGGGGGGRPFTLNLGDESISGLRAMDSAISQIQRYAARKRVQSAGRKPTWHNG